MKIYQFLEYLVEERIAFITLNRPEKRNALNDILIAELKDALMAAEQDLSVKIIVIRGNGAAFCAGVDLDYLQRMQGYNMEQNLADSSSLAQLFLTIYRGTKVVIAQVEGAAIAGGCGLVTVCDFAFVVPEAKLGYTEVRIGFVPAIVMTFLLRKIGETRAKELLLSGKIIDAQTAVDYHIVNQVVPAEEIGAYVRKFALEMCTQNSAASLQLTKKMIADIQSFPLEDAMRFAAKMNAYSRATDDCKRGVTAFLNKESHSW
ncbi:MAG: enoyl-CoA hydratase-related protein [Bacteroidia bacterium]|nr:enoyl-CoA hydratase-related protein [Bacteroidia bacterium]